MFSSIIPIITERSRSWDHTGSLQKSIDSKVSGLVIERIIPIFKAYSAPFIDVGFLSYLDSAKMAYFSDLKKKPKKKRGFSLRKVPIGLRFVDSEGLVNALMQFILFVPRFSDLFLFARRSLDPFKKFIEQYQMDQETAQGVSYANGAAVLWCIKLNWERCSVSSLFSHIMGELTPKYELLSDFFSSDIFLSECTSKKQIFRGSECYDLDAFIERQSDEGHSRFIVYIKVDGAWYQCDNERVTFLRSNYLKIPLQRSVLLHYKRVIVV